MQSSVYYPQLSSLLNIDSLPEQLGFVKDGIENLLDDIFIESYQVVNNEVSNTTSYSISLKLFKKGGLEIPSTGLELIFNPDFDESTQGYSSTIPMTFTINRGLIGKSVFKNLLLLSSKFNNKLFIKKILQR